MQSLRHTHLKCAQLNYLSCLAERTISALCETQGDAFPAATHTIRELRANDAAMHEVFNLLRAQNAWIKSYTAALQAKLYAESEWAKLAKAYNPDEPRVPAGESGGGQWTSEGGDGAISNETPNGSGGGAPPDNSEQNPAYEDMKVPDTWANPSIDEFNRHFMDHADDFDAKSWDDYANKANEFYQKYQNENLPAIEYPNGGEVGVYDPASNTFGVYTPNGQTQTFYQPTSPTYFERETKDVLDRGGKIINPLPASGGRGGSAPLGRIDVLHPFDPLNRDDVQD